MTKLRSSSSTVSASEAKALFTEAKAKRSEPQISAADLAAFKAWQAAKAAQAERASVGVSKMTLHDVASAGHIGFKLEGIMPDAPNDKGAFLNDNKKIVVSGVIYTLQVGLYPYTPKGKGASVDALKALGVVVGEF